MRSEGGVVELGLASPGVGGIDESIADVSFERTQIQNEKTSFPSRRAVTPWPSRDSAQGVFDGASGISGGLAGNVGVEPVPFVPTRRCFFGCLLAYYALHLLLRVAVSEVAGIDEGDQIVAGQHLSWGYGPQPPLFTWLSMAFMGLFGPGIFALTLLRELMLLSISILTYLNGRTLTGSHAGGVAAAVALQFHPTIAWESQRELTHSILTSVWVLVMLWAFFRLQPARWGAYLALGLSGGLAVLSKYNALVFYACLLLAALSLPPLRDRVINRRMMGALCLSFLVVWPHLVWIRSHRDLAFASMWKFGVQQAVPWVVSAREGLWCWTHTSAAHLAGLAATFGLIFRVPLFKHRALRLDTIESRLLWRVFLWRVSDGYRGGGGIQGNEFSGSNGCNPFSSARRCGWWWSCAAIWTGRGSS